MTRAQRRDAARKQQELKDRCAAAVRQALEQVLSTEQMTAMERAELSMDVMNDLSFEFDQKIEELADVGESEE